uniref:Transposase n=1 Tax=Loa loa TaxID=7209 RepID=A0A1I7VVQ4_LOALO
MLMHGMQSSASMKVVPLGRRYRRIFRENKAGPIIKMRFTLYPRKASNIAGNDDHWWLEVLVRYHSQLDTPPALSS